MANIEKIEIIIAYYQSSILLIIYKTELHKVDNKSNKEAVFTTTYYNIPKDSNIGLITIPPPIPNNEEKFPEINEHNIIFITFFVFIF